MGLSVLPWPAGLPSPSGLRAHDNVSPSLPNADCRPNCGSSFVRMGAHCAFKTGRVQSFCGWSVTPTFFSTAISSCIVPLSKRVCAGGRGWRDDQRQRQQPATYFLRGESKLFLRSADTSKCALIVFVQLNTPSIFRWPIPCLPSTCSIPCLPHAILGPSEQSLVLLGAQYAPCVRPDSDLRREILQPQKDAEASYG